jgi:aspartyl-tRNA(Asn)/glutamyl-tRNA(Gln) amidotransferase subunit B
MLKNAPSLSSIELILSNEFRVISTAENGERISQETRRWDEEKGETIVMRSKEEAHDYRYFPEPDMVYLRVDEEWIKEIGRSIPELPGVKKKRYMDEFGLPEYDAVVLISSKSLAAFFDECVKNGGNPKSISNWIMGEVLRILNEKGIEIEDVKFKPSDLIKLMDLVDNGTISGTIEKKVFKDMFETGESPEVIVATKGLAQVSDEGVIRGMVNRVINETPKSIEDFKNGKSKVLGFLVGEIMRASRGNANPQIVNKLLNEELNKR